MPSNRQQIIAAAVDDILDNWEERSAHALQLCQIAQDGEPWDTEMRSWLEHVVGMAVSKDQYAREVSLG